MQPTPLVMMSRNRILSMEITVLPEAGALPVMAYLYTDKSNARALS